MDLMASQVRHSAVTGKRLSVTAGQGLKWSQRVESTALTMPMGHAMAHTVLRAPARPIGGIFCVGSPWDFCDTENWGLRVCATAISTLDFGSFGVH